MPFPINWTFPQQSCLRCHQPVAQVDAVAKPPLGWTHRKCPPKPKQATPNKKATKKVTKRREAPPTLLGEASQ